MFASLQRCGLAFAIASLMLSGCDDPPPQTAVAEPVLKRASAAPPAPERLPEAPALPGATESARAAVGAWLKAQNEGDFEAYGRLYAQKMTGTKRSGGRTRHFQRDGWLADRRRMFRKPVVVRVDDMVVELLGKTAVVDFTQHWSSGTYQDTGPKRIVLVREAGGWRISREEMLSSKLLDAEATKERPPIERFAFLEQVEDDQYLILDQHPESAWGTGPPRLHNQEGTAAAMDTRTDALPEHHRALVGQQARLFGPEGMRCEGKVSGLFMLGVVDADSAGYFLGEPEMSEDQVPDDVPDEVIAKVVMRLGGPLLAAKVDTSCGWALWGQIGDVPEPKILDKLPWSKAYSDQLDAAKAAFFAESEYIETQKQWEEIRKTMTPPPAKSWSDYTNAGLSVTAWGFDAPEVITAHAWYDPCGSHFDGRLIAAYRVGPGGPQRAIKRIEKLRTTMVFDVDLDGNYELLISRAMGGLELIKGSVEPRTVASYQAPLLGCGC